MFYVRTKGQSTLEYVILLGFVVSALIFMGMYMRRGAQGQLREASDRVGAQYEAGQTTGVYTEETTSDHNEQLIRGGHTKTNIRQNEQKRDGWETVAPIPATP